MKIIRPVQKVVDAFSALPGIGPKTAARLAFYLLHVPQERLEKFATSLARLKPDTHECEICMNVGEEDICPICADTSRDKTTICVVESVLDLLAFEKAESYKGVYQILGGVINPMANIGPDELFIPNLLKRLQESQVHEVILATNVSMEGEATALYIDAKIKKLQETEKISQSLKVSRIGRGLPTGSEVEFADGMTLMRALESRVNFNQDGN